MEKDFYIQIYMMINGATSRTSFICYLLYLEIKINLDLVIVNIIYLFLTE